MRIAIVGPIPPPYGGISTHIQRMMTLLEDDGHEPTLFPGISARRWLVSAWGKWYSYDVVHFHDISWKNRVLIGLMSTLGLKVVLTIHGDSLESQLISGGAFARFLLPYAMRRVTHIVGVKKEIRDLLLSLGVDPSRVSVINAFLPPISNQDEPVPLSIRTFVESHTPLIVANGFGMVLLSDGTDLYGIEMIVDLCTRLADDFPELGCVVFLAQIEDQERYDKLLEKISQLGASEYIRIVIGRNLISTLKRAHLFVRPTFQDGYGTSVAEAISLGIPAVASDVCERPEGALTFTSGSIDEFYGCARYVLDNHAAAREATLGAKPSSAYASLLAVYRLVADKGTAHA